MANSSGRRFRAPLPRIILWSTKGTVNTVPFYKLALPHSHMLDSLDSNGARPENAP